MNYFVPDKSRLDIEHCKFILKKWMNTTYGIYSMEPHYATIPHRIIAEQYLGDMSGIVDYKIHCLNGEPAFVLAISERMADIDKPMSAKLDLFDMEWKHIDELKRSRSEIPGDENVKKPEQFARMCEMARSLSNGLKFVRVDLYELNGKVYFGEMTFSPACCVFPYFTEKFDAEMGRLLNI